MAATEGEPTKERTREELLAVMDDVIREGDDLFERTNAKIDNGLEVTLAQSETIMLGARGLNALRSIRLLADYHMDDQVAIVGATGRAGASPEPLLGARRQRCDDR